MKIFWTLLLAGFLATTVIGQTGSISGSVLYKNYLSSQITSNCVVQLYQGTTLVTSVPVNNTGWYSFTNIPVGTYTIKAYCSGPVGGINALDALIVLTNFVNYPNLILTGLNAIAADVNGSGGFPNSTDAITIIRFFTAQIPNYLPPYTPQPGGSPWVSESFPLTLSSGQAVIQNIKVLCRGDVNGSYIP
jgi:hypothetical protein